MTKIIQCKPQCANKWQDAEYGEGKRVFNKTSAQEGRVYRCTCCGEEKSTGNDSESKKEKKK